MATPKRVHQAKPKKSLICSSHIAKADVSSQMSGNDFPCHQRADVLIIAGGKNEFLELSKHKGASSPVV
jgi:hypothetical protein